MVTLALRVCPVGIAGRRGFLEQIRREPKTWSASHPSKSKRRTRRQG